MASLILALLGLLVVPGIASAHVLQANNGTSVVLHIPPEDNPQAGKSTSLDFAFSTDHKTFIVKHCDCIVQVQQNDKTIQTVAVIPDSNQIDSGQAIVTFPELGVYNVLLTGRSRDGSFKTFNLNYLERVATNADDASQINTNSGTIALSVSLASFVLLIMFGYALINRGSRYKS